MIMQPVTSSNIAAIGYSPIDEQLHVQFNNGRTYEYDGVPASVAKELQDADSVGSYFQRNIRNQYPTREV